MAIGSILGVIVLYILYKVGRKAYLKYQAGRNRSYNQFDKAQFTGTERRNLRKWRFIVPEGEEKFI
jgi:hypothetical protein